MRPPATLDIHARQRGAALLILFAIISLGAIFALVAGLNRSTAVLAAERAQKTATALAQAKEALIAYAVTYKDRNDNPNPPSYTVPGYLPCPDLGPPAIEGQAAASCGSSLVSVMGKLPWKTLGIDPQRDGSGECLWYAVSGTYKNNPNGVSGSTNSNMMNWDTNGQLIVMDANGSSYLSGSTTDTNAVAVIFAPGNAFSGQNRATPGGWLVPSNLVPACGGNYTAAAYLETARSINNSTVSGTARAQSTFIAGTGSDTFNDRLVYITRADIWNAIKKRSDFNNYLRAMVRRAAECTALYGQNNGGHPNDLRLPWATNVSLSTTSVSAYAVNANYNDSSGTRSGRLSFKVNTSDGNTGNDLSSSIADYGTNSAYLFTNSSYCTYAAEEKIWYDNWKDQLFYAVAKNYDPSSTNSPTAACTSSTCLKINGAGSYAAVVIFAGDKLADAASQLTQSRNLATDKGSIANYLEGSNLGSITANSGGGNYQAATASSGFNDIVYAIDTALTVKCYSGSSLGMVTVPVETVAPPGDPMAYAACP
jgi:hypothetical protein